MLEQNDGLRQLYWAGGDLVYLRSDAGGEQFGNYLIRRGVLDLPALKGLLAEGEHARVGDRVVQCGLMTVQERDAHLEDLFGSVLLHAMEHPILKVTWRPGPLDQNLSGDLQFWLNHRHLVWDAFHNVRIDQDFVDRFRSEAGWRWAAMPDLLDCLRDLPLTPAFAYALTLLGTEPLDYGTIEGVTGLGSKETARTVATLWALGGIQLVEGTLPLRPDPGSSAPAAQAQALPEPEPVPEPEPELTITLMDDDSIEDSIEPTFEVEATAAPKAMNLMDVLEMEAQAPLREFPSPAGPVPSSAPEIGSDPFFMPTPRSPKEPSAAPPPAGAPFAPPSPIPSATPAPPAAPIFRPQGEPLQAPTPAPARDQAPVPAPQSPRLADPYPAHALPLIANEEDLPPLERARHLVAKAKSYLLQSRTSEATRALEQAVKLDDHSRASFEAWLLLGKVRTANPAWSSRAIEALKMAAQINPRSAQPWALMGELYHRKGFRANAQGCYLRACELDPTIAIPPEYQDLEEIVMRAKESGDGQPSLVGRLKGMFGPEKTSRS
ncbi:MAG TPA: hypothetical protein VJ486_10310 [Geothrix sp.]|nr:hypothetical protein [Geothrix sp.]